MDLDDLRRRLAEHSPGRLAEELVQLAGRGHGRKSAFWRRVGGGS